MTPGFRCRLEDEVTDGGSLAIDAGQSGIKVRHADAAGASEWAGPGIRTDLPLLPQLARVMEDAVEAGRSFDEVGLGVSGLTSDEADAGYLLAATAQHGVRAVHLAHDSITAYLGALGDDRGAVVASGTGVVTLAVGRTELARVDGWGYLLGDAGSGYWLGRAALDAVMRAHDGRGDATALSAIALAEFPDLEHAYIELQADPGRVGRIAAYARHVADAAAAGDAVALVIVSEAGRELAASVIAGLRRVGEADAAAPRVRAVGGVFGGSALTAAFTTAVLAGVPSADIRMGEAHPLDGAAALAAVAPTSALAGHIATATVATPACAHGLAKGRDTPPSPMGSACCVPSRRTRSRPRRDQRRVRNASMRSSAPTQTMVEKKSRTSGVGKPVCSTVTRVPTSLGSKVTTTCVDIVCPLGSLPDDSVTSRCGRSISMNTCSSRNSVSRSGPHTATCLPPTRRSTSISTTPGSSSRIENQIFCFSASV